MAISYSTSPFFVTYSLPVCKTSSEACVLFALHTMKLSGRSSLTAAELMDVLHPAISERTLMRALPRLRRAGAVVVVSR